VHVEVDYYDAAHREALGDYPDAAGIESLS